MLCLARAGVCWTPALFAFGGGRRGPELCSAPAHRTVGSSTRGGHAGEYLYNRGLKQERSGARTQEERITSSCLGLSSATKEEGSSSASL